MEQLSFNKADSKTKEFAFYKAHELNMLEKFEKIDTPEGIRYRRKVWRVGKKTDSQLCIDIDHQDMENLKRITEFLKAQNLDFSVIKTRKGFHIIGKNIYSNRADWIYANALLLNKTLTKDTVGAYMERLLQIDSDLKDWNTPGLFMSVLENQKLLNPVGDFDRMYTYLSIKNETSKSTLRISKKRPNDKYELVIS